MLNDLIPMVTEKLIETYSAHFLLTSFWLPDIVLTYGTTSQSKCRLCSYDNLRTNAFPSAIGIDAEDSEHGPELKY